MRIFCSLVLTIATIAGAQVTVPFPNPFGSYFCATGMVANVEITRLSSWGRKRAC